MSADLPTTTAAAGVDRQTDGRSLTGASQSGDVKAVADGSCLSTAQVMANASAGNADCLGSRGDGQSNVKPTGDVADSDGDTETDGESGGSDSGIGDESGSDQEDGDEDYEQERQRQILQNQALLLQLGIAPSSSNIFASSSNPHRTSSSQSPVRDPPRKRPRLTKTSSQVRKYDRSGHILSLPLPGEKHVVACIELPSDRRLSKRIADGEYEDCMHWAEGEARRWRFGWGKGGELQEGEEEEVGGVGKGFRWRRWRGLEKELRREMRLLEGKAGMDQDGQEDEVVGLEENKALGKKTQGVSAYSLIPGAPCHQCRRKSEKPKMKCRNLAPECKATFCETCCKRYSYFEFDPESRTFLCPLCKDCCNCANCIRKRKLGHLLDGKKGLTKRLLATLGGGAHDGTEGSGSLPQTGRPESGLADDEDGDGAGGKRALTIQDILMRAVKDKIGVPFDRVRLVNKAEDVITPKLPPMPVVKLDKPPNVKSKSKRKSKKKKLVDGAGYGEDDAVGVPQTRGRGGSAKGKGKGKGQALSTDTNGTPNGEILIDPILLGEAGIGSTTSDCSAPSSGKILLRIPRPAPSADVGIDAGGLSSLPRKKIKQVDSDGDTIAGSDSDLDEPVTGSRGAPDEGKIRDDESALTSLPDRSDDDMDMDADANGAAVPINGLSAGRAYLNGSGGLGKGDSQSTIGSDSPSGSASGMPMRKGRDRGGARNGDRKPFTSRMATNDYLSAIAGHAVVAQQATLGPEGYGAGQETYGDGPVPGPMLVQLPEQYWAETVRRGEGMPLPDADTGFGGPGNDAADGHWGGSSGIHLNAGDQRIFAYDPNAHFSPSSTVAPPLGPFAQSTFPASNPSSQDTQAALASLHGHSIDPTTQQTYQTAYSYRLPDGASMMSMPMPSSMPMTVAPQAYLPSPYSSAEDAYRQHLYNEPPPYSHSPPRRAMQMEPMDSLQKRQAWEDVAGTSAQGRLQE